MSANEVVRQANGYDTVAARVRLRCEDESLALQSQKDEADINVLVRRFGITGTLPVRELPEAIVGHVEEFDLMNAHSVLIQARESFESLSANIRARFGNDPMTFVQFCEDKTNLPELRKMGLAKQEVIVEPEKIQKVQIMEVDDGDSEGARRAGGRSPAGPRGPRKANPSTD